MANSTEQERPTNTTTTTSPRRAGGPRTARVSARDADNGFEEQYDLLTAALIGIVVGAGATMLLRRGPGGDRPIVPMMRAAGRSAALAGAAGVTGARWASPHMKKGARWAGRRAQRGAHWLAEQGEDLWDRVPIEDIREHVGEYLESARDTIADTVESELRDLRKAIRRQRKKLGV